MRYNIGTVVLSGFAFAVWFSLFFFVSVAIEHNRPLAEVILEPFALGVPISFFLLYAVPSSFISLCVLLLFKFLGHSVNVYLVFWIALALSCIPTWKYPVGFYPAFSLAIVLTIVGQALLQAWYKRRGAKMEDG